MAETGAKLKKAICKALGIDPSVCIRLDVHADPGDVMSIEATFVPELSDGQLTAIADALIAHGNQVRIILRRGA